MAKQTFVQWLQSLPIPWLFGGPNGQAEAASWGSVLDNQVALLKQAVLARYPDNAPADALPHIGGDRVLIQGPSETNASFIARIKSAWDDWARSGTPLELLVQLYWGGFTSAVIVQQNGLAFSLSGAPTAGADPTALLTITTLGTLIAQMSPAPMVTPANAIGPTKYIPAGSAWWTFDNNTNLCSRFAVLFPDGAYSSISAIDLARLQSIIKTWRRASQACVGVYSLTSGKYWGWPVRTWGSGGTWGPSTVVTINGTWQ